MNSRLIRPHWTCPAGRHSLPVSPSLCRLTRPPGTLRGGLGGSAVRLARRSHCRQPGRDPDLPFRRLRRRTRFRDAHWLSSGQPRHLRARHGHGPGQQHRRPGTGHHAGAACLVSGPGGLSGGPYATEKAVTLRPGQSGTVTLVLAKGLPDGPWTRGAPASCNGSHPPGPQHVRQAHQQRAVSRTTRRHQQVCVRPGSAPGRRIEAGSANGLSLRGGQILGVRG